MKQFTKKDIKISSISKKVKLSEREKKFILDSLSKAQKIGEVKDFLAVWVDKNKK